MGSTRHSTRPRALDLFCGAGAASLGLAAAGFEILGVDNRFCKGYPFPHYQGDWADVKEWQVRPVFDFIWASPPCQVHSVVRKGSKKPTKAKCYIAPLREWLKATGLPAVIENVPTAPLRCDFWCEGHHVGLHNVRRRRIFECINMPPPWPIYQPECERSVGRTVYLHGQGTQKGAQWMWDLSFQERRRLKREAIGIGWARIQDLHQAIPARYAFYIGMHARRVLARAAGDSDPFPEYPPGSARPVF